MTPTVEEPEVRYFVVRFEDGKEATVRADKVCRPDAKDGRNYRFKLDGVVVAEYAASAVTGWRIQFEGAKT